MACGASSRPRAASRSTASGFRAERARPLALIAAAEWPRRTREGIEELAALYGARVLSPERASDVVEWCTEHGGMLDRPQLDRLLEGVEAAPPASAPRAVPPAPPAPRWKRAASTIGNALVMVVVGAFMVGWYGMWLAMGVMIVGGILFGWFDTEAEPAPAKVVEVRVDRERCVITATFDSSRRFEQLNVLVDGNLRNGDPLGEKNFKVGPVVKGRSQLVVARPDPTLCRSRHHFTRPGAAAVGRCGRARPSRAGRGSRAAARRAQPLRPVRLEAADAEVEEPVLDPGDREVERDRRQLPLLVAAADRLEVAGGRQAEVVVAHHVGHGRQLVGFVQAAGPDEEVLAAVEARVALVCVEASEVVVADAPQGALDSAAVRGSMSATPRKLSVQPSSVAAATGSASGQRYCIPSWLRLEP